MKISVITVCYNAEKTIAATISSFLDQDYPNKEMILIDGASSDGTMSVVDRFDSAQIRVMSEPDHGMYDALNKGLGIYSGDAMGVLNADDRYRDKWVLNRIADGLFSHEAVHGDLLFMNKKGKVVREWRARERPRSGFSSGWMPAHPTFYVRRSLADRVGRFDASLATAADYDWMLRAIEIEGATLARIPHVMVEMAMGGRSTSNLSAHLRHNLEALRARRRWLNSGLVDWALIAKPASKLTQLAFMRGINP